MTYVDNDDDDGMRVRLIEVGATRDPEIRYAARVTRHDGEVLEIGFQSLAAVAEFVLNCRPCSVTCEASEEEITMLHRLTTEDRAALH